MNKLYSFLAVVVLFSALAAGQALADDGGFVGPSPKVTAVQDLQGLKDGADVVLQGAIVSHIGDDYYLFKDKSGEVHVEIKDWDNQKISPADLVELHGEVDKDGKQLTVEVSKVIKSDMQTKSK